ncbi:energy-coupling factor transporter transmembrane component T family protein [Fructobacillus ficulneus]|uniref:ABC-type cobalt transport system, permease component CbiQ related transporter n=1 Tax=Fructobacillus ficulneus TaxID=157463 RepID=A0A0K8MI68_9LACO|nr:energy-coupling factor transporter transmembrane component T [Fructobacillus ficulneus]GAP00262.1 ABC-type cobalt transport system, permease component CbiQ related transporter [Fructobacillus ficulneus]
MMNATQRLVLAVLISLEISLTKSVTLNLILVAGALSILLVRRQSLKRLCLYLAVAIIPVLGSFWSFYLYGSGTAAENLHFGMVMGSRVLVFIFIGAWLTLGMTPYVLLASLRQNLKMSATFTYGILGALNFLPRFRQAFTAIQAAGMMRGEVLRWWQPTLYFKSLVHAIKWSKNLAMAMTSHGFQEGANRSAYRTYPMPVSGWVVMAAMMAGIQVVLFLARY